MPMPAGTIWSNHIGLSTPIQQANVKVVRWCVIKHLLAHWRVIYKLLDFWKLKVLCGFVYAFRGYLKVGFTNISNYFPFILHNWVFKSMYINEQHVIPVILITFSWFNGRVRVIYLIPKMCIRHCNLLLEMRVSILCTTLWCIDDILHSTFDNSIEVRLSFGLELADEATRPSRELSFLEFNSAPVKIYRHVQVHTKVRPSVVWSRIKIRIDPHFLKYIFFWRKIWSLWWVMIIVLGHS